MTKKTILSLSAGLFAVAAGIVYAVLPNNASLSGDIKKVTAFNAQKKASLDSQTYANPITKKAIDSIEDLYHGQEINALSKLNYNNPISVNPGGSATTGTIYSNQNNIVISGKTFHASIGDILTFNNCTNVHVTLCIFDNGNVWGVVFNNCKNVTFDYNYGTMLCKMAVAINCQNVKFDNNQFLNLNEPKLYKTDFAHVFQFNNVTGSGNSISYNIIENIYGVAVHPHDLINCFNSSGVKGDSLQVVGNKLRGGMVDGGWPGSGDTGAGITFDNGAFISCRNNVGVNTGCAFIQANGVHSDIIIANNIGVSLIPSKVAADGIITLGSKTRVQINNNRINWLKYNGAHGVYVGGETGYWGGGKFPAPGITMSGNNWYDTSLTTAILPKTIITYHE